MSFGSGGDTPISLSLNVKNSENNMFPITYEVAFDRHPWEAVILLSQKDNSKSKYRDMSHREMGWCYIVKNDPDKVYQRKMSFYSGQPKEKDSIEELIKKAPLDFRVRHYLRDMHIYLRGKAGT